MSVSDILDKLPNTNRPVISILSGGLDSSTATILLVEKYGKDKVHAITFDYGQKQNHEIDMAMELCIELGVKHREIALDFLGDIARPFSANIQGSKIEVPDVQDILGIPTPSTYIPNRNMIMYSIVASQAEVWGAEYIFCGIQVADIYGYWDATPTWVERMNEVFALNRNTQIKLVAPFGHLSKYDEIMAVKDLDKTDLLRHTLTCYNPDYSGRSCAKCASCTERIKSFAQAKMIDPILYQTDLNWENIFNTVL